MRIVKKQLNYNQTMDKKEFIIPITFIALCVAFAVISFAVYLSKGKSKKWVARKMKIGAILITLSASSCERGNGPFVSCYDPVIPNSIHLDAYSSDKLEIKLDTNNVLSGTIYEVTKSEFSFAVINENNTNIQQGELIPADGSFDSNTEVFSLELDTEINPGLYDLKLFDSNVANQENANVNLSLKLQINDQ